MTRTDFELPAYSSRRPFDALPQQDQELDEQRPVALSARDLNWKYVQRALSTARLSSPEGDLAKVNSPTRVNQAVCDLPKLELSGLSKQEAAPDRAFKPAGAPEPAPDKQPELPPTHQPETPATSGNPTGSPEAQESKQASEPARSLDLYQLFSKDCRVNHTVLPDGTAKTVHTAADGSTRTQTRFDDGSEQDKLADRYGRPLRVHELNSDGSWTITELKYQDSKDRVSPFLSGKRVISSSGTITELQFDSHGRVSNRSEHSSEFTRRTA